MNNLVVGLLYMFVAQVGTFIQLNVGARYDWYSKYPILLLLASIPLSWLYIHSVKNIIISFQGEMWPSRILGFGVGIIVFGGMSFLLFNEHLTLKTIISILLAIVIILIQIFL